MNLLTLHNHTGSRPTAPPKRRLHLLRQRCGAALVVGALASFTAQAAGPTELVGPVGPVGPVGAAGRPEPSAPARANAVGPALRAADSTPPSARTGSSAVRGNRIEVTGNKASGVRCGDQGSASVNSVDVRGARLEGQTVIVQGRNARDVHGIDCPAHVDEPRHGGSAGQTNSIRIR